MNFNLKIWRQENSNKKGKFIDYKITNISPDASFLEMLDILNESLVDKIQKPINFDHDCREGICGMCGLYINGRPHGPDSQITVCQLFMRTFNDGDTIIIEPWRSLAFPVIKDLMVDRAAFDKIIQAGGYISIKTGQSQEANNILIEKEHAELAMNAAECIGCGACVAACKNASAMLFVSAKISQFELLPQGQIESNLRIKNMINKMDELGFGNCSNTFACEAECPKSVKISNIARMNLKFLKINF